MTKTRYTETLNDALQYQAQSQNLGFNSDEVSIANGFEFKNDNGIWRFIVQDAYYNLNAERTYELAVFDGKHTLPQWDFSEGYTISFGSEYGMGIDWDGNGEAEDFGTDVCFLSLNGETLNNAEGNLVYKGATTQEIRYPSEQNLNGKNTITLRLGETLDKFAYTTIGQSKIGGATFQIPLNGEEISVDASLDTSSVGTQVLSVSHGDLTKEYEIQICPIINELTDYEIVTVNNADVELLSHSSQFADGKNSYKFGGANLSYKYKPITYKGVTVTSDTDYTGKFKTTFEGNTQLSYKFPGSATDASKTFYDVFRVYDTNGNYVYSIGDGAGDFYFKVSSVSNPKHTFTFNIAAIGTNYAYQYIQLVDDSGATVYSTVNKNTEVATKYSKISQIPTYAFPFDYFNNNESVSESGAVNPLSFKVYKNSNGYWAVNASRSKNRANTWYSNATDFAIFDGTNMPEWDFSEGYTIEFGSNYATGSDICFIGINSDKMNHTDYSITTTDLTIVNENEVLENGQNKITLTQGEKLEFSLLGFGKTYDVIGERRSQETVATKVITNRVGGTYFDVIQELETFEYTDIDTSVVGTHEIVIKKGGVSKMYTIEIVEQAGSQSVAMPMSLMTTSNERYTVTFLEWDGSEYQSGMYSYGAEVPLPVAPTKPADQTYRYVFDHWSPEVVTVTENATYSPVFVSIYIEYRVKFVNDDGKLISQKDDYHYGDEVIAPETPTKAEDDEYTYTFAGWDKEITTVKKNVTYTATYTKTAKEKNTATFFGCNASIVGGGVGVTALLTAVGLALFKKRKY